MNRNLLTAIGASILPPMMKELQQGETVAVTGLTETMTTFLAAQMAVKTNQRILLVCANDLRAAKTGEDAQNLIGTDAAALPGGELELTRGASSHESAWRRLETLQDVTEGKVRLLVTSAEAVMQQMGDPALFRSAAVRLQPGDVIAPAELLDRLIRMGYERVEMVEGKGQCALRGAILDVYPPAAPSGIRIEFFDDEIDTLRAFDCISQRSQESLSRAVLSPASETLVDLKQAAAMAERYRSLIPAGLDAPAVQLFDDLPPLPEDENEQAELFDKHVAPKLQKQQRQAELAMAADRRLGQMRSEADLLEAGIPFRRMRVMLPALAQRLHTLSDWFKPDLIVLVQPDQLRDRVLEHGKNFAEELAQAIERGEALPAQEHLLLDWDQLLAGWQGCGKLVSCELLRGLGGLQPKTTIDLHAQGCTAYSGQVKELAADVQRWCEAGHCVLLLAGGVSRGQRLTQALEEYGVHALYTEDANNLIRAQALVLPLTYSHGFLWPEANVVLIADTDLYGAGYRRSKSRRTTGEKISAFTDLKIGDYVVHEDHGVAIYRGVTHMQAGGTYRDYLVLDYQGTDKLYVPVEQLERVQKYIGNPSNPPKLNRLGGTDWAKQKGKVKEGLQKLAFDLVKLYAERSGHAGYAFGPDTTWQREFEDRFPYEMTPDQQQSMDEITRDMESDRNMDRLLCGDVGYGKTEVSLRAAFKAIMDGKQVAILAPTTVLAQQHYQTAIKRFQGFPVEIDMLSRFRTAKAQKDVLQRLAEGKIDLIVGTHSLLAKSVKYRNLGLLIVDEEQRFGVGHKEIIKNMKTQMDVLTLSATPIPRTLHMSMVGIRDMSVLETPPLDRLPVQTHVVDYSDALVRDAILRELARGGQVFFLYNRVRSIAGFYDRLKQLVPEARIGVAHGQMKEAALEDVMMDFYHGDFDVLLCTTIIESGLDVPTANTLFVYDADRFGLSQLYQLRGRVGRSSRQAYAYFMVRPDQMLSETAQQRLSAIKEFTEFGAGFRIAMRDLEIRGAGNILGPEQHGHLATVGYDMYCKLMEETLRDAQGVKPKRKDLETRVDVQVDAFLPEAYIHDERQRMEMYKRIAGMENEQDRREVEDELIDRFGEEDDVVDALLDIALLRAYANRLGATNVQWKNNELLLRIDNHYAPDGEAFLHALQTGDARLRIVKIPPGIGLRLPKDTARSALKIGVKVFGDLLAAMDAWLQEKEEKTKEQASS